MPILKAENIIWRNHSFRTGKYISHHDTHAHVEHSNQTTLIALGRWCQGQGGRVSQHEAFGGVDRVHSSGSHHYDRPSTAFDLNLGYGNPPGEAAFLDRLTSSMWKGVNTSPPPPRPLPKPEPDVTPDQLNAILGSINGLGKLVQTTHDSLARRIALNNRFVKKVAELQGLQMGLVQDTHDSIASRIAKVVAEIEELQQKMDEEEAKAPVIPGD